MKAITQFIQSHEKQLLAVVLILGIYALARLPNLPESERKQLASHFKFTKQALPEVAGHPRKSFRAVHPSLEHFASWISSVGASVALNDLDSDGLPNDVCYVDPRTDLVIVGPAPGTPARYKPFTLNPAPLQFNPETMAPMGCLPGDFNEDGLVDVMVYYWGRTPVIFLRKIISESGGTAALAASQYTACELVDGVERWYTNAATQADLDGDGHLDLIIGNYFPDGSRILDARASGTERMQHSMSRASNGGRSHMLLSTGVTNEPTPVPHYKDVDAFPNGDIAHGWTLGVGAADLDGDLLPELYFANDFGSDRLLHNLSTPGQLKFVSLTGEKTITTPGSKVLGRDSFKGMGVDFGDLNGDGLLDIYVSNIAAEYALEESHFVWLSTGQTARMKEGVAPYIDSSEDLGLSRSGWGWDLRLVDFNNDGVLEALQATGFMNGEVNRWPELHELAMGNDQLLHNPESWPRFRPGDDLSGSGHNPFFVRAGDGRYYDLAQEVGLADIQVSRGIAIADVDGDGKLDFAVANQWEPSYLYHNQSPEQTSFLGLHLLLPLDATEMKVKRGHPEAGEKGRAAIGATATVYLPDGSKKVAEVDGGNGHSGKRSPDIHFGLGNISLETQIKVDLRWRDRSGQVNQRTLFVSPGWHTVLLGS